MALKVKFTHDGMAKGTEVSVLDYFLAKVGEEVIVPDEALQRFELQQGMTLEEYLGGNEAFSVKHATKKEAEEAFPVEEEPEPVVEEEPVVEVNAPEPVNAPEGGQSGEGS